MSQFDPLSFILGIGVGLALRHYLPAVIGHIAVQLKRTGQHGQAR